MAVGKEILTQVKSIKSTQKITRAMEMVAVSKMRKTQQRMLSSRPYAQAVRLMLQHIGQADTDYKHPYMISRTPKKIGMLVISSDRGLSGGLNINLFKAVIQKMEVLQAENQAEQNAKKRKTIGYDFSLIGAKAKGFFSYLKANILAVTTHIGDHPKLESILGNISVMTQAYADKKIDRLYLAYNAFVSTMSQQPQVIQLLPLPEKLDGFFASDIQGKDQSQHLSDRNWDYIYEPNVKVLFDQLVQRYIESVIYQAVLENHACEQAARMLAMKSATDNASDLISELEMLYNKTRQAAITQEISEIVGGAAAV